MYSRKRETFLREGWEVRLARVAPPPKMTKSVQGLKDTCNLTSWYIKAMRGRASPGFRLNQNWKGTGRVVAGWVVSWLVRRSWSPVMTWKPKCFSAGSTSCE